MTATIDEIEPVGAFVHEAFFYDTDQEYVAHAVPFIEAGLDGGEPVLVAVPERNLALLRPRFGPSADALLQFASMEELGRNPSWIIPAWARFVTPHADAGRPARGIGEPIWASRSPEELVECGRHEALINLAFADIRGFTLLCPYDLASLDPAIIDEAHRNHPGVSRAGASAPSASYSADIPPVLDMPLPPVPESAEIIHFSDAATGKVRAAASALAAKAGIPPVRIADLVVAVSEAVANSVRHGGGAGRIALWQEAGRFLCEIRDSGRITDPLAGRVKPSTDQANGRGLWLMNQLCDLVQVRAVPGGQVIRLHMAV